MRSPKFFYIIVLLLILQAAWIALTARYPQAFDENYHFGLIQFHSRQLLPFFTHQPPEAAVHGAVVRDPSYLYHYLLSFPYLLLRQLTDSQTVQIIVLRFINIGIFVAGLYAFRKLLREMNISVRLSNVVLLFFVLTPVVPLLAAQINYDNLMFYLTGLIFVRTVRYVKALQTLSDTGRQLPLLLVLQIILLGAVGSIVKFPFAPIFVAIVGILLFLTWRAARRGQQNILDMFKLPTRYLLLLYAVCILVAGGLFIERYGVNLVKYHDPVPACDAVLSIDECQAYSPWARDYLFAATYPPPTVKGILVYPPVWIHRTVYESMFTISSSFGTDGTVTYKPNPPLTIANYTTWVVICLGAALAAWYWRRLWQDSLLRVLLLIIAFYGFVLFAQNFVMYLHTGEAVAIHGRYLVPVYPVLYLVLALGFAQFIRQFNLERWRPWLVAAVLVLFLQGGGITVWIVKSDPEWYWQQSQPAARANWLAKDVLDKVVYHQ